MKIIKVKIQNFRGLKNIEFELNTPGIVIVGPNAVGKSTIFEAIRLAKAALFPTVQNELQAVLASLKANAPILNQIIFSQIANDNTRSIEISLTFQILEKEILSIEKLLPRFAILHLQNTNRFPSFNIPFAEVPLLSSAAGRKLFEEGQEEVKSFINALKQKNILKVSLTINPNGIINGNTLLEQEFLTLLCQSLNYTDTYFNYFPADRSLPMGDQPVQIGLGLAQQQLTSYIINPQQKYQLMKSYIINMVLMGKELNDKITQTFSLIFAKLLPGKALAGVSVTHNGNLGILIDDLSKGTSYDIDSMSSGEKNLVLTILFMILTTNNDGIILFDEPELHLNPSVLRNILDFLMVEICPNNTRQLLISTHSPEILASAFERSDATLYHLISSSEISAIYREDKSQVYETLNRLGASTSEILSTKGVIYLEGKDDVEILDRALTSMFPGFQSKDLGGRKEIEKEIKVLQEEEKKDKLGSFQYFIFDLDRAPADLKSSARVKIAQWDRYCLENYLLDTDSIFEVIQDLKRMDSKFNRGAVQNAMKDHALKQIEPLALKSILSEYFNDYLNFKLNKVIKDGIEETFNLVGSYLAEASEKSTTLIKSLELNEFKKNVERKIEELRLLWDDNWNKHCDGKKVIIDIHKQYAISLSMVEFKKRIFTVIQNKKSENWVLIEGKLRELAR